MVSARLSPHTGGHSGKARSTPRVSVPRPHLLLLYYPLSGGEGGGYEGVLPAGLNSTFWDFRGKGSKGDRLS